MRENVIAVKGDLREEELDKIKKLPRQPGGEPGWSSLEKPETLDMRNDVPRGR